jgi:hypothetical protein
VKNLLEQHDVVLALGVGVEQVYELLESAIFEVSRTGVGNEGGAQKHVVLQNLQVRGGRGFAELHHADREGVVKSLIGYERSNWLLRRPVDGGLRERGGRLPAMDFVVVVVVVSASWPRLSRN